MARFQALAAGVSIVAFLGGCATVTSKDGRSIGGQEGVAYYLPKRDVKFSAERKLVTKKEIDKQKSDASDALDSANAAKKAAEADLEKWKQELSHLADTSKAFEPTLAKRDSAQAAVTVADLEGKAAKAKLDEADALIGKMKATGGECLFTYSAKMELMDAVADPAQPFTADFSHNILRDDDGTLTVTKDGLLSSGKAVATDRTGDIIVELAGALSGLGIIPVGGESGQLFSMPSQKPASAPDCATRLEITKFVYLFDPVNAGQAVGFSQSPRSPFSAQAPETTTAPDASPPPEANATEAAPAAHSAEQSSHQEAPAQDGSGLVFEGDAPAPSVPEAIAEADGDARSRITDMAAKFDKQNPFPEGTLNALNWELHAAGWPFNVAVQGGGGDAGPPRDVAGPGSAGALFYRTAAPVLLQLRQCATGPCSEIGQPVDAAIVSLPQAGRISYIPMRSSAFVKTTDDVAFENGMLTSWSASRPSEVMEIVRLPVRVLTSIVSVPAQLISLRFDLSDKQKSLADIQQSQIESRSRLDALRLCLTNARSQGTDALSCFPED
ncbi:hypothetical protein [Sphingobium phenoxybenzoativorans]|uniref:hypothetical protein n=1 Tax=Sphingobium phenoxybenzoativorans TaxID=1592790 RepID=UPI0008732A01|nr:hypothetical protein [Sphingobium phenoxybenzoativorans]